MDAFLAAAGLVFVAELGDKTQLVALSLGARYRLAPVLVGIALAYAATNLLSTVVGGVLGATLPTTAIGIAGGLLFLFFAYRTYTAASPDEGDDVAISGRHVVRSVAGAMFVAELGDKTMLTTATLAARSNPAATWAGATVGIIACGALAVFVGRALGTRIPERATRVLASVLFAAFGVFLLVDSLSSL